MCTNAALIKKFNLNSPHTAARSIKKASVPFANNIYQQTAIQPPALANKFGQQNPPTNKFNCSMHSMCPNAALIKKTAIKLFKFVAYSSRLMAKTKSPLLTISTSIFGIQIPSAILNNKFCKQIPPKIPAIKFCQIPSTRATSNGYWQRLLAVTTDNS